jgi:ABC-2 type transport system permease protein
MNIIGFQTLIEREFYRFARLWNQTITPPLISTVMYILIFGYSLGSRIKEIDGFSYIIYILPGLIMMSVVNNAYANSSTSLYMARLERSIENVLCAPLHRFEIVSAFILGGILRGGVVGLVILAVSSFFVHFPLQHPILFVMDLIITSIFFAGLGLLAALWAESWEKIALFTNYIITPLTYLGGVFYSIHMLPPFWQKVSYFNPIFYSINIARYSFLGVADTNPIFGLIVISTLAIGVYALCVWLFWKGTKLVR